MKGLMLGLGLVLSLYLSCDVTQADELPLPTDWPATQCRAEYRVYKCDSQVPKYWVNKDSEGKLIVYDDPSMQTPKLEVRNDRIYRPNGFFPLARIKISDGKIFRRGSSTPVWRIEKVISK